MMVTVCGLISFTAHKRHIQQYIYKTIIRNIVNIWSETILALSRMHSMPSRNSTTQSHVTTFRVKEVLPSKE